MTTNGIRQQWRQMSLENEINMDIEKRVKLDADAIRQRRERRNLSKLNEQWDKRVSDETRRSHPVRPPRRLN